jgi:DNA-binding MarR family transcriptional regulator
MTSRDAEVAEWTLLTSHARVLVEIARDPEVRMRDLAAACDMTERSIQAIIADLEQAGYLTHSRVGRRNRYTVHPEQAFRHRNHSGYEVRALLEVFTAAPAATQGLPAR